MTSQCDGFKWVVCKKGDKLESIVSCSGKCGIFIHLQCLEMKQSERNVNSNKVMEEVKGLKRKGLFDLFFRPSLQKY